MGLRRVFARMIRHTAMAVFTPTSIARLNFVERSEINSQIVNALRTPGKQVIIYGETGGGKSTLLANKLDQLYEGAVFTRCSELSTFESLLLAAFDEAEPYIDVATKYSVSASKAVSLQHILLGIRGALQASSTSETSTTSERAVPIQLTAQRLAQFLGLLNYCWVIEDFHKVAPDEKVKLAQALKIFCDTSMDYPHVRVVALGAMRSARDVIAYDPEMANRVAEIEVPLMSDKEIGNIIDNGAELLNIDFGPTRDLLVLYSMGVASICHQLCLNMCQANDIDVSVKKTFEFSPSDLQEALETYVRDVSDTFRSRFERAFRRRQVKKYDNARLILRALSELPVEGALFKDVLSHIRQIHPDYPSGNLTNYLRRLQDDEHGGLVRMDDEGRFRYVDAFHQLYAHLIFSADEGVRVLNSAELEHRVEDELRQSIKMLLRQIGPPKGHQLHLWTDGGLFGEPD